MKLSNIASSVCLSALVFASLHVAADSVTNDDAIIVGSMCIGTDCVNGEVFGFDTVRLSENNTRIRFVDTSRAGSFPTVDWQLTANESLNGGLNMFALENIDRGTIPMMILDGAPSYSVFVSSLGNVGFGTDVPSKALDIEKGDTPTIRFTQNNSFGWDAQVWDVGANEVGFFVKDADTFAMPLRIAAGQTSTAFFIDSSGNTGLQTLTPDGIFDIAHPSDADDHALIVDSVGNVGINIANGAALTGLLDIHAADGSSIFVVEADGDAQLSGTLTAQDVCGSLGCLGTLHSSKALKNIVGHIDTSEILSKVMRLRLSQWTYKSDVSEKVHIGPMSEDFHAEFGFNGDVDDKIAIVDAAGVALASIQALNTKLEQKDQEIAQLRQEIEAIKQALGQ